MEYGICSSYSSGSSFWHGSYTTKRIASKYAVHDVKVVSEGDAAEFTSISVERSMALAECDRLQPGERVAAFGAAAKECQLVADEPAATVGENGRSAAETRPVLLAAAG